jgi:hypothetical protein
MAVPESVIAQALAKLKVKDPRRKRRGF